MRKCNLHAQSGIKTILPAKAKLVKEPLHQGIARPMIPLHQFSELHLQLSPLLSSFHPSKPTRTGKVRYQLGAAFLVARNTLREHTKKTYSCRAKRLTAVEAQTFTVLKTEPDILPYNKHTYMPQSPLREPLTTPTLYHACATDDTAAEPRKCEPQTAKWIKMLLLYSLLIEPLSGHEKQQ